MKTTTGSGFAPGVSVCWELPVQYPHPGSNHGTWPFAVLRASTLNPLAKAGRVGEGRCSYFDFISLISLVPWRCPVRPLSVMELVCHLVNLSSYLTTSNRYCNHDTSGVAVTNRNTIIGSKRQLSLYPSLLSISTTCQSLYATFSLYVCPLLMEHIHRNINLSPVSTLHVRAQLIDTGWSTPGKTAFWINGASYTCFNMYGEYLDSLSSEESWQRRAQLYKRTLGNLDNQDRGHLDWVECVNCLGDQGADMGGISIAIARVLDNHQDKEITPEVRTGRRKRMVR